jgi:hypothetical protein
LGWVLAWAVFAVLYVWLAAFPSDLIGGMTASWYSDRFRLAYILAFLGVPLMGWSIAAGLSSRRREAQVAGGVLLSVLAVTSATASVSAMRDNVRDYSLVGTDEREAFAFLADRVASDEHVVNQHQDGSAWMYSLAEVVPLQALKTFDYERPEWRDALYLARHVQEAGTNAEVDRLLQRFKARFVYVGPSVFPVEQADIDPAALDASPGLRRVFVSGGARVYEVVP